MKQKLTDWSKGGKYMKQKLTDWTLTGHWPNTPLQSVTMETGIAILPVTPEIKATVPGEIHNDLLNAGIIENPYYETNSVKCEWVEKRWWVYKSKFNIESKKPGEKLTLVFEGIDYSAHIYLNGQKIGEHTGMYVPCRIDVTDICLENEENNLRVVIEQIPDEMGQVGWTSHTFTQKSRFGYKWDFGTRLVSLGLYDEVYIERTNKSTIDDVHIRYIDGKVRIKTTVSDTGSTLNAKLTYGSETIAEGICTYTDKNTSETEFYIENPKLWYPNGYGEQPLYNLELSLYCGEALSQTKNYNVGLRTITYHKCNNAPDDSLPYIFAVNGIKMPVKGVNITPLDHMYGAVTYEKYEKLVLLAKEANVNMIRVWGGGMIEKEMFYDLCDKHGILVWQDFIQSSSGIENAPSEDPDFLELLGKTSEYAVRSRRNHPCLAIWCGGNELIDLDFVPITYENKNVAMLKEIVEKHDPDRLFLPTTSSGPTEHFSEDQDKNHDIHGPWKYLGPEEHYRFFNELRCLMLGECGSEGMSCMDTLEKILAPENQKVFGMAENLTWSHHGQLWDAYTERDKDIFGEITDLEKYVYISQFMQAESIRYSIESQMRKFPKTAGICIWQLNEPWPNVCCANLIDYYGNPKLAYHFLKRAFGTYHVSAEYKKLLYEKDDIFEGSVFLHDELTEETSDVTVNVLDINKNTVFTFSQKLRNLENIPITFPVKDLGEVFYIECKAKNKNDSAENIYMYYTNTDKDVLINETLKFA